jgi:sulfoxide reductase heme-binding subunit YedZ
MLGLFAYFYVFLHFMTWLILDQDLLLSAITEDIVERPFITIGFAAFLILTALAATSTAAIRRRMGRSWQKLHNFVYVAAILGVWHYWWQVKLDASDPAIYAALLAIVLAVRIWHRRKRQRQAITTPAA